MAPPPHHHTTSANRAVGYFAFGYLLNRWVDRIAAENERQAIENRNTQFHNALLKISKIKLMDDAGALTWTTCIITVLNNSSNLRTPELNSWVCNFQNTVINIISKQEAFEKINQAIIQEASNGIFPTKETINHLAHFLKDMKKLNQQIEKLEEWKAGNSYYEGILQTSPPYANVFGVIKGIIDDLSPIAKQLSMEKIKEMTHKVAQTNLKPSWYEYWCKFTETLAGIGLIVFSMSIFGFMLSSIALVLPVMIGFAAGIGFAALTFITHAISEKLRDPSFQALAYIKEQDAEYQQPVAEKQSNEEQPESTTSLMQTLSVTPTAPVQVQTYAYSAPPQQPGLFQGSGQFQAAKAAGSHYSHDDDNQRKRYGF
jgi:hypothetical protein